jgi:hypothetical protein
MRSRLPLFVVLASALAFLASLYLPWQEAPTTIRTGGGEGGALGLLNLFYGFSRDGWAAESGYVAALLAVALVLVSAAGLARPAFAARLPIGALGLGLAYFSAGLVLEERAESPRFGPPAPAVHPHWSYGLFMGAASAGAAALAGLPFVRGELIRSRATADVIAGVLYLGVLLSFLLPWTGVAFGHGTPGLSNTAVTIAALVLGASCAAGAASRRWRLPVALATAVLTGAAAGATPLGTTRLYGAWLGVGCAVSLAIVEAVRAGPWQIPAAPRGWAALRTSSAALLLASLFLPWLQIAFGLGDTQVTHGWEELPGAVAGGIALLLLAAPAAPVLEAYTLELVAAIAFLVSWVAATEALLGFHVSYGSFIGFTATALLIVSVLAPLRPARVEWRRRLALAVPIAASVACLGAVVVPPWEALPWPSRYEAVAVLGWSAVAALFLSLYLIRIWIRRLQDPSARDDRLVLVPLVLLVLPALQLIRARDLLGVALGGWILVGLCLALAALGWVEQRGGLSGLRLPEILRIDRLPEVEG